MKKNEIEEKLFDIFNRRCGLDFRDRRELMKEHVFGPRIDLPARELVYIMSDVESIFGIKVPNSDLVNKKFCSFESIYKIVLKQVEGK